MYDKIAETAAYLRTSGIVASDICVITGTGLGGLAADASAIREIPYADIPGFPVSTVGSHKGSLLSARVGDAPVLFMQGRFHLYEGYEPRDIAFPLRVAACMGVHTLIVTNAAGGVNPSFHAGDIMIIEDHINLTGANPLTGMNDDKIGPRFPLMQDAYSSRLRAMALEAAGGLDIPLKKGVYLGLTGPSMETDAEYRMVRALGGDAVGMSTVTEVIAAVHAGMEVLGFSVITNQFEDENENDFKDVVSVAQRSGALLSGLITAVIKELDNQSKNN